MDKFLEKLNKAKSKVNLSPERKEDLYLRIISASMDEKRKVKIKPAVFWKMQTRLPMTVFAGFLGLMVITAGTSFASEGSLPGDILYPLKRNLNENVLRIFANTTQEKAQLASNLLERRLSEATQLASNGRLTQEISDDLELDIEKTSEEARIQISSLQEEDMEDVAISEASHLEAALKANSAVLRGVLAKKEKEEPRIVTGFDSKVWDLAMRAEGVRTSIENSMVPPRPTLFVATKSVGQESSSVTATDSVAEKKNEVSTTTKIFTERSMKEALRSIENFKEKIKEREKDSSYNSDAVNEVIKEAERDIEDAKNNFENNDLKNSLILINQSHRKIGEAEIINEAEKRLNVKVFETRDSSEDREEWGIEGILRN